MNKHELQFGQIVDKLAIEDRPDAGHKESLRRQMLAVYMETSSERPRGIRPVWRKIMKLKTIKTVAAAVIVLAAFIILTQTNGTGLVLANVIKQFSRPYQCTQTVSYGGKEHQRIKLYRLNLSQRREERDNNKVFIVDLSQTPVRTLYLHNNDKFAEVTRDYGMGPCKDPDFLQMLANMELGSAEKLGVQTIGTVQAEGFRTVSEYNDITIWADVQTGLPVKVEIIHPQQDRKIVFENFIFDVPLDPKLFSTEPPAGYRVYESNLNQQTNAEKEEPLDPGQKDVLSDNRKPYSFQETVYRNGEKIKTSKVYRKNLSIRREEREDGTILVFDLSQKPEKYLTLKPENMMAKLEVNYKYGPRRDPDMLAWLERMRSGSAEKLGIHDIKGVQAEGFHEVADPYNEVTIWADVQSGLPVKIEIVHPKQNQKIVQEKFDFETNLEDSLFSTTPPEGYTLNEKHEGLDLKAQAVTKEQVKQETAGYPVYTLNGMLSWTMEPTMMEANVPGMPEKKVHIVAATSKTGRHVVLCQCPVYTMLKDVIRGGNKCLELNGFTVWNGGPEKMYSKTALDSAQGMIPPGVSGDRTGYAIETPQDTIIIVGVNGALTDKELKELVENLELSGKAAEQTK